MNPIFRQEEIQVSFAQNGFVKFPLLGENQSNELFQFFKETQGQHATVSNLHHTTTDTLDRELMLSVDEKIKSLFMPELEKVMVDIKPLAATFHIKEPGEGSHTGIHQDPTFVDETRFQSINVWVALQDIGPENGNLYFVPGSHQAVHSLRPMPMFPRYYEEFSHELAKRAVGVPLKKGEAVAFSNATIHGATDNLSDSIRLAATLLVCPKVADWILYYNDPTSGELTQHPLDLEIFHGLGRGEKPKSSPKSVSAEGAFPQISYEEFLRKTSKPKSLFRNLRNLFWRKANV